MRDRASYAFAAVSLAAVVTDDGVQRFAFGGLAHKPWRIEAAEIQSNPNDIADAALADARTTQQNGFKLTLARRTLASTLAEVRT